MWVEAKVTRGFDLLEVVRFNDDVILTRRFDLLGVVHFNDDVIFIVIFGMFLRNVK